MHVLIQYKPEHFNGIFGLSPFSHCTHCLKDSHKYRIPIGILEEVPVVKECRPPATDHDLGEVIPQNPQRFEKPFCKAVGHLYSTCSCRV